MTADSFKALVENAWFKLGARLLGWVAVPLLFACLTFILTLRADVSSNREFSEDRAGDNEKFQAQVLKNDAGTQASLEALRNGQIQQALSIANMSGILTEMQRRDVAIENARPFIPTR